MKLQNSVDVQLLEQHMTNGIVRRQVHPLYPELYIYNYTEQAQFQRIWDSVTSVCRGLIVAGDEILARGFNKFHNLNTDYAPETQEANLPKDLPLVTTKLDGSMGVLYWYDGKMCMATRGSFASEQSDWATKFVRERYPALEPTHDVSAVFEIIYASNRIVVDYDWEGIVLLGLVRNKDGSELSRAAVEEWAARYGIPVVKRFDKTLAECAAENTANEEGYVLTYSNGVKVKVKFTEYVRLHRILTGLNPKTIWELLAENQTAAVDSIVNDPKMPVAFLEWFTGWVENLKTRYAAIEVEAKAVFDNRPSGARKEQALYFLKSPDLKSVLFAMLDGKNHAGIIWDRIKPKGTDTFKKDGE